MSENSEKLAAAVSKLDSLLQKPKHDSKMWGIHVNELQRKVAKLSFGDDVADFINGKLNEERYELIINYIKNNIAYVTVFGEGEDVSSMEIPVEDLQADGIEVKEGIVCKMVLTMHGRWEKLVFSPIKRGYITHKELQEMIDKYEEKYGGV